MWAVLLLLPTIPVVTFYVVVADQNYFELTDAARGVVTTGPIAASSSAAARRSATSSARETPAP